MIKPWLFIFLVGCATTGTLGGAQPPSPQVSVRAGSPTNPTRIAAPQLPSVDAISARVRDRLGDEPSVKIRMCVAGDGRVDSVQLVHGTTMEMFDQAVLRDASTWRFAAIGTTACAPTTIVYRPAA